MTVASTLVEAVIVGVTVISTNTSESDEAGTAVATGVEVESTGKSEVAALTVATKAAKVINVNCIMAGGLCPIWSRAGCSYILLYAHIQIRGELIA